MCGQAPVGLMVACHEICVEFYFETTVDFDSHEDILYLSTILDINESIDSKRCPDHQSTKMTGEVFLAAVFEYATYVDDTMQESTNDDIDDELRQTCHGQQILSDMLKHLQRQLRRDLCPKGSAPVEGAPTPERKRKPFAVAFSGTESGGTETKRRRCCAHDYSRKI